MAKYLGVDWASKGWFGVILRDDGDHTTDLFPSIWNLWQSHSDADQICIDIPIGLPTDRPRACDREAKQLLQDVNRRVFYTPTRAAIAERNLDAAKEVNEEAGYSIQNQAWSQVPRIREVDGFLHATPTAQDVLIETHPELCFFGLADRTLVVESKQTSAGINERLDLLSDEATDAEGIYEDATETFLEPEYAPLVSGPDDIVDALAAAVTAQREADQCETPPSGAHEVDDHGLPMQMVYPDDTTQTTLPGVSAASPQ
jgi:predicted RNase H-like nuclease